MKYKSKYLNVLGGADPENQPNQFLYTLFGHNVTPIILNEDNSADIKLIFNNSDELTEEDIRTLSLIWDTHISKYVKFLWTSVSTVTNFHNFSIIDIKENVTTIISSISTNFKQNLQDIINKKNNRTFNIIHYNIELNEDEAAFIFGVSFNPMQFKKEGKERLKQLLIDLAKKDFAFIKNVILNAIRNTNIVWVRAESPLGFAPKSVQDDKDVVLEALKNSRHGIYAWKYVSYNLKEDQEVIAAHNKALAQQPYPLPQVMEAIQV